LSHQTYSNTGEAPKAKPARLIALGLGVGMGALVLAVTVFFLPVQWAEAKLRFRLWQAGARTVLWEKHRGFTQDRCAGRSPAECACVWLFHGMGDSVTTWKNVFLDPAAFGEIPVRLYAIDLPGHGGSIRRHDLAEYRVSNLARELDAEIARIPACAKNILIGNSFGGWIAARMALASSKHYFRLILIGAGGLRSAESAAKDLFKDSTVESLKEFQRRAYFKPRELSEKEWASAAERMKSGNTEEVRDAQVDADRLDADLGKIHVGTFLIWGAADRVVPREVMEQYARGLPQSRSVVLPECGHLPQKECPAKLFPELQRAIMERFPGE